MDRFAAMSAFAAVADQKGFAPAARKLGLSPSAVTRYVAALEDRLGIRLLQRTTRSVILTDAWTRFLQRVRRVLSDLDEAEGFARAERVRPMGRLVVSAPVVFGRRHVGPLMCTFLSLYAEVVGELLLADRMVNLVEEGVDLAVRIGHLSDSSLVTRKVGATRRVVVASPGYLDRHGTPHEPAELASREIIQFTGLSQSLDWHFAENGRERRVTLAPRYVTNSAEAAIQMAERDGGLAMVLAYQVTEAVVRKRLIVVLEKFEPPALPIQFVYPTSRLLSANVRTFIDTAAQRCNWNFIELRARRSRAGSGTV
jgi:DNA-binding transcriptional LysR family regulator